MGNNREKSVARRIVSLLDEMNEIIRALDSLVRVYSPDVSEPQLIHISQTIHNQQIVLSAIGSKACQSLKHDIAVIIERGL